MPSLLDINNVYNRDFMAEFIANHSDNNITLESDFKIISLIITIGVEIIQEDKFI